MPSAGRYERRALADCNRCGRAFIARPFHLELGRCACRLCASPEATGHQKRSERGLREGRSSYSVRRAVAKKSTRPQSQFRLAVKTKLAVPAEVLPACRRTATACTKPYGVRAPDHSKPATWRERSVCPKGRSHH